MYYSTQLPLIGHSARMMKLHSCCHYLQAKEEQEKKEKELRKTTPHFWNLNEDSQLSGKIHHFIKPGNSQYDLSFRPLISTLELSTETLLEL